MASHDQGPRSLFTGRISAHTRPPYATFTTTTTATVSALDHQREREHAQPSVSHTVADTHTPIAVVDYDDGDTTHREPDRSAVQLHANYEREWGIVMDINAPTGDGAAHTLHIALLDQAFDNEGEAIDARYMGPTLFEGMKIEEDYPPFKLGSRHMDVPDSEDAVRNAGTLFAYQAPFFFGIENADDEDDARQLDIHAGSQRRTTLGNRLLPSGSHEARHATELTELRASFVNFTGQVRSNSHLVPSCQCSLSSRHTLTGAILSVHRHHLASVVCPVGTL